MSYGVIFFLEFKDFLLNGEQLSGKSEFLFPSVFYCKTTGDVPLHLTAPPHEKPASASVCRPVYILPVAHRTLPVPDFIMIKKKK